MDEAELSVARPAPLTASFNLNTARYEASREQTSAQHVTEQLDAASRAGKFWDWADHSLYEFARKLVEARRASAIDLEPDATPALKRHQAGIIEGERRTGDDGVRPASSGP